MELNDYDKEILMVYAKPLSELIAETGLSRGKLAEYKDFKYKDKQVYVYNGKYYYYGN